MRAFGDVWCQSELLIAMMRHMAVSVFLCGVMSNFFCRAVDSTIAGDSLDAFWYDP